MFGSKKDMNLRPLGQVATVAVAVPLPLPRPDVMALICARLHDANDVFANDAADDANDCAAASILVLKKARCFFFS